MTVARMWRSVGYLVLFTVAGCAGSGTDGMGGACDVKLSAPLASGQRVGANFIIY